MVEQVTFQTVFQFLQTVGILVGVFYYIMSLRNQNKARKTQLAWQMNEKMSRQDMIEARAVYFSLDWSTPEDFVKYFTSIEGRKVIGASIGHYEGIGVLVREGLLDIRVIALLSSGLIRRMWEQFLPIKDEARRMLQWPRLLVEVEYLYGELIKFHEENPEVPR